ncbi:hypothetical protein B566_EDAN006990 [Ephemera danica]|nr:hypothetical protein B566_EDAN006990 [Ephemera danica]
MSAYELSQDLLEKQVEMLERKYGGAKARRAALIIQRAFRRYKLLHKFAAITAMAKAEKRLSRRLQVSNEANPGSENAGSPLDWSPSHRHYQMGTEGQNNGSCNQQQSHLSYHQSRFHCHKQSEMASQQQFPCEQCVLGVDPEVVIQQHFASLYRELRENERPPRPVRSMSLRERRGASGVVEHQNVDFIQSYEFDTHNTTHPHILPRSHSAGMQQQQQSNSATLENDPFDREVQSYSQFDECCMYYTSTEIAPCPHFSQTHFVEHSKAVHYMTKEELADEDTANNKNVSLERDLVMRRSPPSAILTNSQWTKNKVSNVYMVGQVNNTGMFAASSEWGPQGNKKVPPEVPKRTTSILSRSRSAASSGVSSSGLSRGNSTVNSCSTLPSAETASLSSSDSSLSLSNDRSEGADLPRDPQVWQQKAQVMGVVKSSLTKKPESCNSDTAQLMTQPSAEPHKYRVGLNLFNKKPERGISHLIKSGFLENSSQGVARFLITRKGLSKQMIGEYLGTLLNPFNMAVLESFVHELDLSGMPVDVALRRFQTYFRMPGEAQKIERLMEVFGQRYCLCNPTEVSQFHSADTVFVLAFAVIMLNTDLHTPNLKPERRMKMEDFIKNLRGIDDGHDINRDMLIGIYERVRNSEFKPGSDHVTQVIKVQSTIGGKKPNLAQSHRRLVCYCRLYEIPDVHKKERTGVHQREVFLFNDIVIITKIFNKKKTSVAYSYRQSFTLCGMMVSTFESPYYPFGIKLSQKMDGKSLVMFNARNEHDRGKFTEDLRESICEMDEMEAIRIETELERQKSGRRRAVAENRDSGVADVEVALSPNTCAPPSNLPGVTEASAMQIVSPDVVPPPSSERYEKAFEKDRPHTDGLKRSALSNSLLDIHDQCK